MCTEGVGESRNRSRIAFILFQRCDTTLLLPPNRAFALPESSSATSVAITASCSAALFIAAYRTTGRARGTKLVCDGDRIFSDANGRSKAIGTGGERPLASRRSVDLLIGLRPEPLTGKLSRLNGSIIGLIHEGSFVPAHDAEPMAAQLLTAHMPQLCDLNSGFGRKGELSETLGEISRLCDALRVNLVCSSGDDGVGDERGELPLWSSPPSLPAFCCCCQPLFSHRSNSSESIDLSP